MVPLGIDKQAQEVLIMTTVIVTIFHKMGETLFRPYAAGDPLAKRYSHAIDVDLASEPKHATRWLDKVWRLNNVVTGDELPTEYLTRSLSVGDVFVLDYGPDIDDEAWCVEMAGFEPVLLEDLWSSQCAWDVLKEELVHNFFCECGSKLMPCGQHCEIDPADPCEDCAKVVANAE